MAELPQGQCFKNIRLISARERLAVRLCRGLHAGRRSLDAGSVCMEPSVTCVKTANFQDMCTSQAESWKKGVEGCGDRGNLLYKVFDIS